MTEEAKRQLVDGGMLSIAEAAKLCAISRATMYCLMESGHLPYVKIGKSRRIPRTALVGYLAANIKGGWASNL